MREMNSGYRVPRRLSRRSLLKQGAAAGLCAPFILSSPLALADDLRQGNQPTPPGPGQGSATSQFYQVDEAFLEELENAHFQFFWEQANSDTGIVRDRCNAITPDKSDLGSIAALGFGLTALCIGDKRGYVPRNEARGRALNSLRFLWKKLPNHRGFFYHWANVNTGERLWDSEVSSIDTAILLCGVLMCGAYFEHSEISELASMIFNRVDWSWLSEDTTLLPHGWRPETGFLQYRWDDYSEMMMMYLLGLGSTSYLLPTETWDAWKRQVFEYDGVRYISSFAPLFVHQYSQAWFDFRNKHDKYADYFENSITATKVHRQFCIDLASQFPDYSENLWGITASDSPRGYVVWGGPPATGPIDGTVVPCASGGSLPFLPQECLQVLQTIKNKYGKRAWTRYGFVDAFNPLTDWYDTDVIGIDVGITMLMAENARTGFVWETFMKNPEAQRGMKRAGFLPNAHPAPAPVSKA
ncbi:MAG TPA: glucoamylase family protein [Candidatus Acidoferrales bacterium]